MRWLLAVVFAAVPTVAVPVWACAHAAPSGLATRHVPGYGISIAVPSTWQGISPPASAAGAGLKYFYRAPEMVSGFSANLNLIVTPLPPGLTLREWLFSGASAAYQYIGTTTTITVDGVRGLHFKTTKATRFGCSRF
jgi:hypothetical protein